MDVGREGSGKGVPFADGVTDPNEGFGLRAGLKGWNAPGRGSGFGKENGCNHGGFLFWASVRLSNGRSFKACKASALPEIAAERAYAGTMKL